MSPKRVECLHSCQEEEPSEEERKRGWCGVRMRVRMRMVKGKERIDKNV